MSPKSQSKSQPKKAVSNQKAAEKPEKKEKKLSKGTEEIAESVETPESEDLEGTGPDFDELEEQEEEAAAKNAQQGGNAAALAAASSSTEMSASFKNFRHHPDMENFYRFIFENDLRHEALAIVDEIIADKQAKRLGKPVKSGH